MANRSTGALASAVVTACSTAGGTARSVPRCGTGSLSRFAKTACAVATGERRLPREHFVEHAAQRVEIAPAIEVALAHRLLGAHVGGGADRQAGLGELLAAGGVDRPRDAEIGHPRVPAREQDVFRLDVAVNHLMGVGIAERIGHLAGDLQRWFERQLLLTSQAVAERFAFDQRHDVIEELAGLTAVQQRQDVGMVQLCRDRDLAQKPLRPQRRSEFRPQHLERHLAVVLQVLGEVDGGHAAGADLALDAIAVDQCGPELFGDLRHAAAV